MCAISVYSMLENAMRCAPHSQTWGLLGRASLKDYLKVCYLLSGKLCLSNAWDLSSFGSPVFSAAVQCQGCVVFFVFLTSCQLTMILRQMSCAKPSNFLKGSANLKWLFERVVASVCFRTSFSSVRQPNTVCTEFCCLLGMKHMKQFFVTGRNAMLASKSRVFES